MLQKSDFEGRKKQKILAKGNRAPVSEENERELVTKNADDDRTGRDRGEKEDAGS